MKIAIIGAGISGLTIANMLKDENDIILFDKENKQGGLIKCDIIDSVLFHKVGGHVFNSKNKEILDWFWSFFNKDEEFLTVKRNAKIYIQNKFIGYPIENYLYDLDSKTIISIISELSDIHKKESIDPFSYSNFEEFLKNNFGDTLYNIYFKPYNKKIWQVDLSTVPMEWLEGKLPMPNFEEIIINNILRKEESKMVHSSFFYPKKGGSQFIVDKLSKNLDIRVNCKIDIIKKEKKKFTICNETNIDKIIYCGDIRNMPEYINSIIKNEFDLNEIKKLRSNGTSNLLCETDDNDLSWLYLPENWTKAHRIIYTGNFSVENNGNHKRKTCVVEFSGKIKYEEMLDDIKKLPGNLTPINYNYESSSYIIHNNNTKSIIDRVKNNLKEENIYLLGRFAEWEYYNMDKCIESAMTIADSIIKESKTNI